MGLDAPNYDLGPPLAAQCVEPVSQHVVSHTRKLGLVGNEAVIGEGISNRVVRWPQALRILLRHGDGYAKLPGSKHEAHAPVDNTVRTVDGV
jgi:hypothetical protein